MTSIQKRPQVIRDLIELATYIAEGNMDASDRFLIAAEETFNQLGEMPKIGKLCQFSHPNLIDVRQEAIKVFRRYLIFYRMYVDVASRRRSRRKDLSRSQPPTINRSTKN